MWTYAKIRTMRLVLVAQIVSALAWSTIGVVFVKYITSIHAWSDYRMIAVFLMSPIFGLVVGAPHYRLAGDRTLMRFVLFSLLQLCLGIMLLGATIGLTVALNWVVRGGAVQWVNAPVRIVEAAAWTIGLASMSAWFFGLWILAFIDHVGLWVIQSGTEHGISNGVDGRI